MGLTCMRYRFRMHSLVQYRRVCCVLGVCWSAVVCGSFLVGVLSVSGGGGESHTPAYVGVVIRFFSCSVVCVLPALREPPSWYNKLRCKHLHNPKNYAF